MCYADSPTAEYAKYDGTRITQTISCLWAIASAKFLADVITALHSLSGKRSPTEIHTWGWRVGERFCHKPNWQH